MHLPVPPLAAHEDGGHVCLLLFLFLLLSWSFSFCFFAAPLSFTYTIRFT